MIKNNVNLGLKCINLVKGQWDGPVFFNGGQCPPPPPPPPPLVTPLENSNQIQISGFSNWFFCSDPLVVGSEQKCSPEHSLGFRTSLQETIKFYSVLLHAVHVSCVSTPVTSPSVRWSGSHVLDLVLWIDLV